MTFGLGPRPREDSAIGSPVEIVLVAGAQLERAFRRLPHLVYRDDPAWVAPLAATERDWWSPARNATLAARRVERFLARRGGRVVGRIAAIVDPAFQGRWDKDTGFFGAFECLEDGEAARALLWAAETALGTRRMIGPINLSTNDETGLLVAGFGRRPMLLSPYNPAYYPTLLAGAGYRPQADYHAYLWTPATVTSPAAQRLLSLAGRRGVAIRASRPKGWGEETATLWRLYNASFAEVWGFVPLSEREFAERAAQLRRFYRPEFALFAEHAGEAIGFALLLPDVNAALAPLRGRLWPFGWLRLLRQVPRIRDGRFILIGVLPEWAGRGVGALLARRMMAAGLDAGLERVEISLVHDGNCVMRRLIEAFGCQRLKTYRLYQKTLSP